MIRRSQRSISASACIPSSRNDETSLDTCIKGYYVFNLDITELNLPLSVTHTIARSITHLFQLPGAQIGSELAHVPYGYIAEAIDVPSRVQRTCFLLAVPARERSFRRACRAA